MDVVYLTKRGLGNYFDLRYSLRSLCNLPHDKVWIIGSAPTWAKGVKCMSVGDNQKSRYKNTLNKLMLACKNPTISEDFILMNDDFFILNPIDEVKYYKLGEIKEHVKHRKTTKSMKSAYADTIIAAHKLFPEGSDFETHTPMVINKQKLLDVVKKYGFDHPAQIRTLYCNELGIKGEKLPNTPIYNRSKLLIDCKCYAPQELRTYPNQPYLSTSDFVSRNRRFIKFMNEKFPKKCSYEG